MKTIVIAGACSNAGKTTLARAICDILPEAVFIKIGTGRRKEHIQDILYPFGTPFQVIKANHARSRFLIIESNHILNELEPDLCIFLDGRLLDDCLGDSQDEKPSAALARQKADLRRGLRISEDHLATLAQRLTIPVDKMAEICFLAGAHPEAVSSIIIAGGESSRMGQNKALLPLEGKPLIRRLYDALLQLSDEVIISVGEPGEELLPDAITVPDLIPDKGPLMGIYSCLCTSSSRVNFVMACDIPEINLPLVRKLLSYSPLYDIVVPSFKPEEYEPLFAVYTKAIIDTARMLLDHDQRRINALFPLCKTKVLKISDYGWYANLNTPEDYEHFMRGKKRRNEPD